MAGVEVDSSLLSQCLDFCQALASQGHAFNLSVAIGASFTFSLDTRSKDVASQVTKKKASPSTLRKNTKRREEYQLGKQRRSSPRTSGDPASAAENMCDQCEYVAASEKGLRQHIRMKHKEPRPAERIRSTFSQPPLVVSPIKEQRGWRSPALERRILRAQMEQTVPAQTHIAVTATMTTLVNATSQAS